MSKHTLGQSALQDIRSSVMGLRGAQLSHEVVRLAEHHGCSVSRVYEVTKDLRAPRKQRADKGKRRADLLSHDGLRLASELIVTNHVDPDLALETAKLNGHDIPVSLGTVRRYLREKGISRRARRHGRRPHRNFEATFPGEMFQFDISGVKERWVDVKTRRILHVTPLDVSKNHPNRNPDRVPLWKFTLVDDYSRLKYVRFVACHKPTSMHVIDFLLGAFRELGVPRVLYSDNDAVIVSKRMRRAASILDRAFAESGGFKLDQHLPGNAQATGKAEVGHQIVEKFEKLIGVKYETPGLAELETFSLWLCDRYNWTENRATDVQPMLRWQSSGTVIRVPPPALLDSAFKADEFTRKLNADCTISFNGQPYQLPRKRPFTDWIGKTLSIVWPPESDFFVVIGLDGFEYEIERKVARPDAAGEFKTPEESTGQQTIKALKASASARKAAHKESGTELLVPGFDSAADTSARPALMPKRREELEAELLAALSPGAVPPSIAGRLIGYWNALELFIEEGLLTSSAADKAWLKCVFKGREQMPDTELRAELDARKPQPIVTEFQRRA